MVRVYLTAHQQDNGYIAPGRKEAGKQARKGRRKEGIKKKEDTEERKEADGRKGDRKERRWINE